MMNLGSIFVCHTGRFKCDFINSRLRFEVTLNPAPMTATRTMTTGSKVDL